MPTHGIVFFLHAIQSGLLVIGMIKMSARTHDFLVDHMKNINNVRAYEKFK